MNRLILIGNGFDLAHGLKTSYCNFISDYISSAINCFYKNHSSIDPLLDIRYKFSGHYFSNPAPSKPNKALDDLETLKSSDYVTVQIKSGFLGDTLRKVTEVTWVDLENDYFEQLLKLKTASGFSYKKVIELNCEFDFLKSQLELYLSKQINQNSHILSDKIRQIFCEPIKGNDIVTYSIRNQIPKKIMLLSFNYTNTLESYKEACSSTVITTLNYIHGELNKPSNPIIFGFGDEFNKSYLEFEELKNNELLKHIKSFGYFKASNYHNLVRFLEDDVFQVFIMGHSLGLSDRTMLKEIFEHSNCKSVKIFYYLKEDGSTDYTEKTFNLSSHFTDKGMMRKKIVPFDLSFAMPQPGE